tara:strand:+ start:539 stop:1201 length:663 start_codon:yes stop_codon:yes gene_type:complete
MKTLVIAPHADDEILGVGGTLLKRKSEGHELGWLIVTKPNNLVNWTDLKVQNREKEIENIKNNIPFDKLYQLDYFATELDQKPFSNIVNDFTSIINSFEPQEIFVPHFGDVHSDHEIVHKAAISSSKSFRNKNIKRILAYETISETEYGLDRSKIFSPNLYVDISEFIARKLELLNIYKSEINNFPFPRSKTALLSLARFRGSSCNCEAAEAFEILKLIE